MLQGLSRARTESSRWRRRGVSPWAVLACLAAGAACASTASTGASSAADQPAAAVQPAAGARVAAGRFDATPERVYVTAQDDASVAVVDASTGELLESVDLTAMGFSPNARPHHVAVEPDGSFWYVSLIGDGKVLKLDAQNRLVGQADFETPGMLALDPSGELLYVGRSMAAVRPPQRLGVIERATMTLEELDVFIPRPHALVVDPEGRRVFTASLAENRLAWTPIGSEDVELMGIDGPMHMVVQFAVSPDGRWLVGGGQMSGDLLVWDITASGPEPAAEVHVGGQPWHPVFSQDGTELWVPNLTEGTVTVVDTGAWKVADVVAHSALAEPHGSAVSADGRTVFVSARNTSGSYGDEPVGMLVAIDAERREVRWVTSVGRYAAGVGTAAPSGGSTATAGTGATGAASTPAATTRASGQPAVAEWTRRVAPFSVSGPEGVPYAQPFLGGFNQPRPQLVDIDGDGDDDLFVQEATGSVMFFEHVGGSAASHLWRTDAYEDLDVGEWYRFVDMDDDGDLDLLAEEPFSYVRYYRNDGGPTEPRFTLVADTLRDVNGEALFSDRQNIPNATDLDCDGRMDLLIGRLVGTISHYEEQGLDESGAPRFALVTDRFEDIEIVAQFGSAHGANTMALGDFDRDGDEDLFWGDFFEAGLLLIENRGACARPDLTTEPRRFPLSEPLTTSGYNAPTLGDADGDGNVDLVVGVLGGAFNPNTTTVENLHWLERDGDGSFRDRTSRFIGTIDVGSESVPVIVDLDDDGVLDLLVSNKIRPDDPQNGAVHRFRNVGSPSEPELVWDGVLEGLMGGYHVSPAFGDLDGDGDLDAVVGTWDDALAHYRNEGEDGSVALILVDSAVATLTRGRNATPALGDLDGDGDLDLVVGESSGELSYFRNDGTVESPSFTLVSDAWKEIDAGRRSFPVLEDLDGDGDLDLLVGSESDGIRLFVNEGTSSEPFFVEADEGFAVPTFGYAAPAFGDLDGDGDRDLLLGGTGGGLWYFERR